MRSFYTRQKRTKLVLIIMAALIISASMYFSNQIVEEFRTEEQKKVELWIEAYKILSNTEITTNYDIILKIMNDNTTIPIIVLD